MTDRQPTLGLTDSTPIDTVEEYQFEPIKGYPMLQWHGKRPFRSTRYYPAQRKEIHGLEVDGWRSKIYWGDKEDRRAWELALLSPERFARFAAFQVACLL